MRRQELFADTPADRRRVMSKVRSTGTRLEARVDALLAELGTPQAVRWSSDLPGKPDFAWPDRRVGIFVNSCFWHGCPRHFRPPKSRVEYWSAKIRGNRQLDRVHRQALRGVGWTVLTVWEHDLKSDRLDATRQRVRRTLRRAGILLLPYIAWVGYAAALNFSVWRMNA